MAEEESVLAIERGDALLTLRRIVRNQLRRSVELELGLHAYDVVGYSGETTIVDGEGSPVSYQLGWRRNSAAVNSASSSSADHAAVRERRTMSACDNGASPPTAGSRSRLVGKA